MTAVLKITDGTTTVDLIKANRRSGFHLGNWRPAVTQFKEDGVWQDSPLGDGRRLADYRFANAIETFELVLDGHDQDGLARIAEPPTAIAAGRRLLEVRLDNLPGVDRSTVVV